VLIDDIILLNELMRDISSIDNSIYRDGSNRETLSLAMKFTAIPLQNLIVLCYYLRRILSSKTRQIRL
jgi:hypothetical protein